MRKTVAEIEREYGVTPIESAVAAWYRDNLDVWGDRGVSITVREFAALLAIRDELLAQDAAIQAEVDRLTKLLLIGVDERLHAHIIGEECELYDAVAKDYLKWFYEALNSRAALDRIAARTQAAEATEAVGEGVQNPSGAGKPSPEEIDQIRGWLRRLRTTQHGNPRRA